MSLPIDTLPFDTLSHETRGAESDPFAQVYDQLHQTMLEMVSASLERLRRGEMPLPPRPIPWRPATAPAARAAQPLAPPRAQWPVVPLSSRESEVLQRLANGDSNKAIARALKLSPHTVKRHVANILAKLDVQTRGQAAAWLTRH